MEVSRKIRQKGSEAEKQELFDDMKSQVMPSLPHLHIIFLYLPVN